MDINSKQMYVQIRPNVLKQCNEVSNPFITSPQSNTFLLCISSMKIYSIIPYAMLCITISNLKYLSFNTLNIQ